MLVAVSCIWPLPLGTDTVFESGPLPDWTHSRLAASPEPLPLLARAATTQAISPIATTIRAPRGGRSSGGSVILGSPVTARQYWNPGRIRQADDTSARFGGTTSVTVKATRAEAAEARPRAVNVHGGR